MTEKDCYKMVGTLFTDDELQEALRDVHAAREENEKLAAYLVGEINRRKAVAYEKTKQLVENTKIKGK